VLHCDTVQVYRGIDLLSCHCVPLVVSLYAGSCWARTTTPTGSARSGGASSAQLKKEGRGAARELRKDNLFLAAEKAKEKEAAREERKEKNRKGLAFLEQQEHAYKSGQLGGRKKREGEGVTARSGYYSNVLCCWGHMGWKAYFVSSRHGHKCKCMFLLRYSTVLSALCICSESGNALIQITSSPRVKPGAVASSKAIIKTANAFTRFLLVCQWMKLRTAQHTAR